MKVLMFGWEFPPHISGGLGTACYGLTRGLSHIPNVDVLFVVPKAYGDEDQSTMRLVGANQIPVAQRELSLSNFKKSFSYIEVGSKLVPYVDPDDFWRLTRSEVSSDFRFVQTNSEGKIDFSGKYGADLLQEITNYAIVANVIAQDNQFDVIHAHDWLAYPAGIAAKEASGKPLVVHVHAFAEEMNKSRRMAAMQSRALAAAGFAVLQIDLLGRLRWDLQDSLLLDAEDFDQLCAAAANGYVGVGEVFDGQRWVLRYARQLPDGESGPKNLSAPLHCAQPL